jgi:hypothetical protein
MAILTPQLSAQGYVLPPHWTPLLARALRRENDGTFYEIGSLPAAQAFGAPPRIDAQIEYDSARGALVVRALRLGDKVIALHRCDAAWIPFWLESLPRALEAEIRRRRATVPMRAPQRPTR